MRDRKNPTLLDSEFPHADPRAATWTHRKGTLVKYLLDFTHKGPKRIRTRICVHGKGPLEELEEQNPYEQNCKPKPCFHVYIAP